MNRFQRIFSAIALCAFLTPTVTASDGSSTMDIYYGIQITVDGQTATLTDVNGEVVYPFVSDGTTYVPIRAVSELLGAGVLYEAETNTAHIFSKEVMDNYNHYGTVTAPETQSFMTQDVFDIFKLAMNVEKCIDEYNYIDQNINGVLYKYIFDEDEAVDFIKELRGDIADIKREKIQDISSWVTLNFASYSFEIGKELRDLRDNLETAFAKMDDALTNLEDYIDHPDFTLDSQVERYYKKFEESLAAAREAATFCATTCDSYIETYVNFFDENIN